MNSSDDIALWKSRAQKAYAIAGLMSVVCSGVIFAVYAPHQKSQQQLVGQIQQLQWELREVQKSLVASQEGQRTAEQSLLDLQAKLSARR